MELTDNEMIDLRDLNDIIAADYVGEEFSGWVYGVGGGQLSGWFHEFYTYPKDHVWSLWKDVRN